MGVDGDPGNVERVAEDDVGGLAADAGQRHQVVHGVGHVAVEPFHQFLAEPHQRVGLVAVEAGGPDELFEFGAVGLRVVEAVR